jgi:hypothetical protein
MTTGSTETRKVVLDCGECAACPAVEISPEGVVIGEDDNVVRLTHAQWNDLVQRVLAGELGRV